MDEDIYFSVSQVAIILKVHPLTVRRYIKEGRLRAIRAGGNVRITKKALDSFTTNIHPNPSSTSKRQDSESTIIFTLDDPIFRLKGRGLSLKALKV